MFRQYEVNLISVTLKKYTVGFWYTNTNNSVRNVLNMWNKKITTGSSVNEISQSKNTTDEKQIKKTFKINVQKKWQ